MTEFDMPDELYCLICGGLGKSMMVDVGKMLHEIKIPSCKSQFGHVRIVHICVNCADDLRKYLSPFQPQ